MMEPEGKLVVEVYAIRSYSLSEVGLQVKTWAFRQPKQKGKVHT